MRKKHKKAKKKNLHRLVEDLYKESRLCSSIHRYHQKGALPKEALKEIHKRWVIYTDSQSSMQSMKYKENHPI